MPTCRAMKILRFPAKVGQGVPLPPFVSWQTVNKGPLCGLSAIFWAFLSLLLVTLLSKMALQRKERKKEKKENGPTYGCRHAGGASKHKNGDVSHGERMCV